MTIRLEELAAKWRTILADIRGIRAHVSELQELVQSRTVHHQTRASPPAGRGSCYQHTRRQSSEVFGPRAAEILELQHSTCEFWARCVNMYLQRTTDRANKNSVSLSWGLSREAEAFLGVQDVLRAEEKRRTC